MNVLLGCVFSGVGREEWEARGHVVWTCDLLPTEDGARNHFQGDIFRLLRNMRGYFDLAILHPPCTRLAVSGARWFKDHREEQEEALRFVQGLMDAEIEKIALENPVSVISSRIRPPDQIVHPWWFGTGETKATCLWLKNLPPLVATNIVAGRVPRVHHESPGPDRWKRRSITDRGMAAAMAAQWG